MRTERLAELSMAKPPAGTMSPPFAPRRKSRIKSDTYTTLVRILSRCYQQPHLCQPLQTEPIPDNGSDAMREASDGEVCDHGALCSSDGSNQKESLAQKRVAVNEDSKSVGLQDRGFHDTQVVIDGIESMMRVEDDVNFLNQDHAVIDTDNETSLENRGIGELQQLLIDELQQVMQGNKELVCEDNCNILTRSLNESQSGGIGGDSVADVLSNQEKLSDSQPEDLKECSGVGQQQVNEENLDQNIFESSSPCLNKCVTSQVLKPSNCSEDRSSQVRTIELTMDHEIQQKVAAPKNLVCTNVAMGSSIFLSEDGMEEGELSGDFWVDDRSVDALSSDAPLSEKKLDENQTSDDVNAKIKIPSVENNDVHKNDSSPTFFQMETIDNANNSRQVQAKDSVQGEMMCKRKIVVYEDPFLAEEVEQHKKGKKCQGTKKQKESCGANEHMKGSGIIKQKKGSVAKNGVDRPIPVSNLTSLAEKRDQNAVGNSDATSNQQDAGPSNKKKRGPPSEKRKAKKKEQKRKTRAKINRELGVKRLKLQPVVKPKPVKYCRHFLNGRCHEGEKCRFSHDTTPLTKSKPCRHFACHSCMKGDDCPFDHQLSKYPCTNYVAKGFCIRGDDCKFSHKIPVDSTITSNVSTPDLKSPSLPGSSNSKKQLDFKAKWTANAIPDSMGAATFRSPEQNVAKGVTDLPPKGISFLSFGKPSIVDFSHSKLGSSSPKSKEGVKTGNQMDQSAAGIRENINETSAGTTQSVTPKGINFLSFGKAPFGSYSSVKLTSLHINQSEGIKFDLPNKFFVDKQASASQSISNGVEVGKEVRSVVSSMQSSNQMMQKNELSNISSSHEASTDGFKHNTLISLNSNFGKADSSVKPSTTPSGNQQTSSEVLKRPPASPFGATQSSDQLAPACLKNSSISTQKALMSTLAFAAKVGSEMKQSRPSSSSESSLDHSAKV